MPLPPRASPAWPTGSTIESRAAVELGALPWPVFDIAASAIHYPFFYSSEERADLGALAVPQTFDASGRLADWARGFVRGTHTDTLALLKDMVAGVAAGIGYQSREEEGTQTPLQTIDRGWGSCRDFAVLFAEAARSLGFGARIISGYLYNPDRAPVPEASGPEGSALGRARLMRGPRSSCQARAGSPSIRPTGLSAATISSRSPSAASSPR